MSEEGSKYLFRPPTIPTGRNIGKNRTRQRNREVQIPGLEVISRPRENFFKLFFQRDKYLWVIFHEDIKKPSEEMEILEKRFEKAYANLGLPQSDLPIVTNYQDYQRWSKDYLCKVAVDESAGSQLFRVLDDDNAITVKVITQKNANIVKKIRKHKHSYKVRGIYANFDEVLPEIKRDMEKVKIETNKDKLQKVRLPNFMKLKLKDKADLIRYRNNLYCLAYLHKNKTDLQASKKRFVSQCEAMYTTPKDKQYINYYATYPFNDTEILKFYTEDSFFYRCLNNTLRLAKTPDQFFIIGDPFNKMFHAIKHIYRKQYPYSQSRKNLKLYRGTDLSETQTKYIENCFGSYIEIHGFVSTTEDLEVAKKFARERNHNKIIEIIFEDIDVEDQSIIDNDYGFVNLVDISKYEEKEILFNALNIFKVIKKQKRGDFQFYILQYGSIFNILGFENPQFLKKNDRIAYYTYKELMGQKVNMEDYGQVFLKSNETQKSVDYYEAKITEAKGQNKVEEVQYTIKKSQALIQNGQPAKALETMILLISERGSIKRTEGGAKFLQTVLQDKGQIIKEIDITKKYTEAGQSLDKFDEVQSSLTETDQALEDVLRDEDAWDFDVAFGRLEMKMKLAHYKEEVQNYQQMAEVLKDAEQYADQILEDMARRDIPFQSHKKLLLQKTLIYQLMAKISDFLEGQNKINMLQIEKKYDKTQQLILELIEQKSYDRSLVEIRKAEIKRHRQDFNFIKSDIIKKVMDSLMAIRESSINDKQVPKTYHLLSDMEKTDFSLTSTRTAIDYLEKQYTVSTQYYSQYDPRSIKTVIDIAQCHRQIKNSKESLNILKEQIKIIPFRNRPQHTIVTKTLYTMGMAYLDLGQYSYSLKCFQKGINMLREILSKKQYEKYHHRYKIQMQMGRTLTFLLKYNEAEERLNVYHMFIVELYKNQHSDIANSLNHFAILYMKWKRYEEAKAKFEESATMFKMTSGQKSLVCAKIKCNLAMVYAIFKEKDKALKEIDKAKQLFDELYYEDDDESTKCIHRESFMIFYYYAEIHKMFNQYEDAIYFYHKSIQFFRDYASKRRKERENKGSITLMGYSLIQSKGDIHVLSCEVKILECKVKIKDFSFQEDLTRIITAIQRQMQDVKKSSQEQSKQEDKSKSSQLQNLLAFCKKLNDVINKKRRPEEGIKASYIGSIPNQSLMVREIKKT